VTAALHAAELVVPASEPRLWIEAARAQHQMGNNWTEAKRLLRVAAHSIRTDSNVSPRSPDNLLIMAASLFPKIYSSRDQEQDAINSFSSTLEGLIAQGPPRLDPLEPMTANFFSSPPHFALSFLGDAPEPRVPRLLQDYAQVLCGLQEREPMEPADQQCSSSNTDLVHVGIFSSRLWGHAVGRMLLGITRGLSLQHLQITFLDAGPQDAAIQRDPLRRALAEVAENWVHLSFDDRNVSRVASEVRALDLDVLLFTDLGMEWQSLLLSCSRLAPVQLVTHGHPLTTGMPQVDYFVSYERFEPPCGAQELYAEPLVTLEGLIPYPVDLLSVSSHLTHLVSRDALLERLGLAKRRFKHLFVVPQLAEKVSPSMDGLLQGLLDDHPAALLVLLHPLSADDSPSYEEYLRSDPKESSQMVLQTASKALKSRISQTRGRKKRILLINKQHPSIYGALLREATLVLDTWPFGGYTTTIDALSVGGLVITAEHPRFARGRASAALIRALDDDIDDTSDGMQGRLLLTPHLVASTLTDLRTKAKAVVQDPALAHNLRQAVVQRFAAAVGDDHGGQCGRQWTDLLMRAGRGEDITDLLYSEKKQRELGRCDGGEGAGVPLP